MPRLRKTVDHETGEVYHVETTRQAKRRYQKTGGTHMKPSVGQINAADIWNKQEEDIKKNKEREEKRRRNKSKQEAKDAKQKALQEELLQAGRIRVEDTWGKVNASQNRLHKFFSMPEMPAKTVSHTVEETTPDMMSQTLVNHAETNGQIPSLLQQSTSFLDDLENIFTNSPLSQSNNVVKSPESSAFASEEAVMLCDDTISVQHSPDTSKKSSKRKRPASSQSLMPPPKRPHSIPNSSRQSHQGFRQSQSLPACEAESSATPRSPLKQMTELQVKLRGIQGPESCDDHDLQCGSRFIATQVVRDTLSGLCSQDLSDDFTDEGDKENTPVAKSSIGGTPGERVPTAALQNENAITSKLNRTEDVFEDSGFDEFDDDWLDEESLLSLAATQRLKQSLVTSSKRRNHSENKTSNDDWLSSPIEFNDMLCPASLAPRLSDSFATDGINDDDLLRKLEDFENNNSPAPTHERLAQTDEHAGLGSQSTLPKKRRVLPWVKNPISYSFGSVADGSDDYLVPALASQSLDE